jgi:hypothetical protein
MIRIIGYAYTAALHCTDCACSRFGADIIADRAGEPPILDDEGNPISPVFSTDEPGDNGDYCDDCKTNLRS